MITVLFRYYRFRFAHERLRVIPGQPTWLLPLIALAGLALLAFY